MSRKKTTREHRRKAVTHKAVRVFICRFCGRKARFDESADFYPFCSQRCRFADLGNWADEKYRLKGGEYGEELGAADRKGDNLP